jgi:hypothetical protein
VIEFILLLLYKAARAPLPKAFSGAGTGAASAAMKSACVRDNCRRSYLKDREKLISVF